MSKTKLYYPLEVCTHVSQVVKKYAFTISEMAKLSENLLPKEVKRDIVQIVRMRNLFNDKEMNIQKFEDLTPDDINNLDFFATVTAWSENRQVFKADADFTQVLIDTEGIHISKDMWNYLPCTAMYIFWCKNQGNNTMRMKVRTSVISSFYRFLRKKKLISTNPTEFIEAPKKSTPVVVQTFLTTEQVALMREKLIQNGDIQLRLYAMISLSTMARLNAIASIRWDQIDLQNCVIHDVLEKENKIVDLYFNDETKQLLLQLQEQRKTENKNDHGWLFYTPHLSDSKHISKTTLYDWCKKIGQMIGVKTLHPHDLRHSGANLLKYAGMDLEDISILLNHENTGTTLKYYIKQDKARINAIKSRYNF